MDNHNLVIHSNRRLVLDWADGPGPYAPHEYEVAFNVCAPEGMEFEEARRLVCDFMVQGGAERHRPFLTITIDADVADKIERITAKTQGLGLDFDRAIDHVGAAIREARRA